jgi:tRNA(Ile)-lysidine synthase
MVFQHSFSEFNHGIPKEAKIGLAISGGLDSVCLLHLFLQSGYKNLLLLHVNYNLRGAESIGDMDFVKKLAIDFGLDIQILQTHIESKTSIQEMARSIRYSFFEEQKEKNNLDFIATAHHQNDSAETILFNLSRKTGVHGLMGLGNLGYILRPLLFATRTQLVEYAKQNHLHWREDYSNAKDTYSRNFIRHHVLPQLEKIHAHAITNIVSTGKYVQEEIALQKSLIEKVEKELWESRSSTHGAINIQKLREFEQSELLLFKLLEPYGFDRESCKNMLAKHPNAQSGQTWHAQSWKACLSENMIFLQSDSFPLVKETSIPISEGSFEFKHPYFSLVFEKTLEAPVSKSEIAISIEDASKLNIRFYKGGESISLGKGKGSKKVSDVFNEGKIPVLQRKHYPLVYIASELLWIPELRTNPDRIIKDNSNNILLFSIKTLKL